MQTIHLNRILIHQCEYKSEWVGEWETFREFPDSFDFSFKTVDHKRGLATKFPDIWIIVLEP